MNIEQLKNDIIKLENSLEETMEEVRRLKTNQETNHITIKHEFSSDFLNAIVLAGLSIKSGYTSAHRKF